MTWNDPELAAMAEELADIDRTIDRKLELAHSGDRLLSADEIEAMPLPPWLVTGHLIDGSFILLAGEREHGKTFLALDWAMSIATGEPWHGHPVSAGPVVYIAAEGAGGIGARVRAWKEFYGIYDSVPLWFLPRALQMLHDDEVERLNVLIGTTLTEKPKLIVVDTLNRCFRGGNENDSVDMGNFIGSCEAFQRVHGCAVLVIHHFRRDGQFERGHTSLGGAVDTIGFFRKNPAVGTVTLSCQKQKDFAHWRDVSFVLSPHGDSCILKPPLGLDLGGGTRDPWDE